MMENPLTIAIKKGNLAEVKQAIDDGVDVNTKNDQTPLFMASSIGNLEVTKYLIEKGAIANTKNYYFF